MRERKKCKERKDISDACSCVLRESGRYRPKKQWLCSPLKARMAYESHRTALLHILASLDRLSYVIDCLSRVCVHA